MPFRMSSAPTVLLFLLCFAVTAPAATAPPHKKPAPKSTTRTAPKDASGVPAYHQPPMSPGDTLVAKIGPRYITLADFRGEWARLQLSQRPVAPDAATAYRVFLNDLVNRDLLALEAERLNVPLTKAQDEDVLQNWHTEARNQLFYEEVQKKVEVDTTQVERFRSQLTRVLYLSAFLFRTQELAQAWYTRLVGGTPVSRLEAASKNDGPDDPKLIVLGNKIREDFDTQTANILFALAPGRLSTPVPATGGWALIELESTRPRPNGIAAGSRETVIREMRRLAANSYKEVFRDSLARSVHITYHDAAMDTILNRFLLIRDRTQPREGGGAEYHMFQPMPVYLPGDSALVLATSDLGKVTGGDLYRFLAAMDEIARPEIKSRDQLRPWVDRVAFDQVLLELAIQKGYDRDPEVLRDVALHRAGFQVQGLYADSIANAVRISEKEARDYYDSDTLRWEEHESMKIWLCATPTRVLADSIMRVGKTDQILKELAFKFTMLDNFAENGGMTPSFTREACPIPVATDSVFSTPVGSFGGPIASGEGWVFWKALEHRPTRMRPYAEEGVHDDVVRAMRNEREEAGLQAFLGRLRKRYPIETHDEWLAVMAGAPSKLSGKTP